jgi:hypothetical protein
MPTRRVNFLLLAPMLFLAVSCGSSSSDPTTNPGQPAVPVGDSLAAGDTKLQTGLTSLATADLLAAANAYASAAAASTTDAAATTAQKDRANFFGSAALLAILANPGANTATARALTSVATLNTFGDILTAYGLGGTAADRANLATIKFVDCAPTNVCKLKTFPANSPSSRDIQAFLLNKLGGALAGVVASLEKVSSTFQASVTFRNATVDFDYTDVLAVKAFAQALLGAVQLQAAYDFGFDVAALQASTQPGAPLFSANAFLAANPTLLTLTDAPSLAAAKGSFLSAIASAKAAVASLRAETGSQANDFIKISQSQCTYAGAPTYTVTCTTTYNPAAQLDQFVAGLDQVASVIGATGPVSVNGVLVDPTRFFSGVDLRAMLPRTWNAGASGNLPGKFPDDTFGGIFVNGVPQVNADANLDGSPDWLRNLNVRLPKL